MRGAANAPLSNQQKTELILLMKEAWEQLRPGIDFEAWRYAQIMKAADVAGLRCACQRHYLPLKAHFLNLVGKSDAAFELAMRSQVEPHEFALTKLRRECQSAGLSLEYPRAIARHKFKTSDLGSLSEKQIWHLMFSVRRRGQKNRAHKSGGEHAGVSMAHALAAIKANSRKARESENHPF